MANEAQLMERYRQIHSLLQKAHTLPMDQVSDLLTELTCTEIQLASLSSSDDANITFE